MLPERFPGCRARAPVAWRVAQSLRAGDADSSGHSTQRVGPPRPHRRSGTVHTDDCAALFDPELVDVLGKQRSGPSRTSDDVSLGRSWWGWRAAAQRVRREQRLRGLVSVGDHGRPTCVPPHAAATRSLGPGSWRCVHIRAGGPGAVASHVPSRDAQCRPDPWPLTCVHSALGPCANTSLSVPVPPVLNQHQNFPQPCRGARSSQSWFPYLANEAGGR